MSFLLREEVPNSTLSTPEPAGTNLFGDIVCPHCGINIITPLGYVVQSGNAICVRCGGLLCVTEEVAVEANRRSSRAPSHV